jgi:hypothetical protein
VGSGNLSEFWIFHFSKFHGCSATGVAFEEGGAGVDER